MRHPTYRAYPEARPRESVIGKLFTILFMVIIAVCFILLALNNVGLLDRFVPAAQTTVNGVAPALQPRALPAQQPAIIAPAAPVYAPLPTVAPAPVQEEAPAEAAPVMPTTFWTQSELDAFRREQDAFYDTSTIPTPEPAFVQSAIGGDGGAKACGGSPLCGGMTNAQVKATMEAGK